MICGWKTEAKTNFKFLIIFILCIQINGFRSHISGSCHYLLAFCPVPCQINTGKCQQGKLVMPHVPDISASWHRHVLGSPRVVVQNSPASGVHTLDNQMIQHHFLLGSLNDLLLHCPLCDQAVNIHLRGKKRPQLLPGQALLMQQCIPQLFSLGCWHCLFMYRCAFSEEKQAHSLLS